MTTTQRGLLLFAHGSRNENWTALLEKFRAQVAESAPQVRCELCFLELAAPDFAQGVGQLVARGCTHIAVVPIFLAPGKHTEVDLPQLVAQAQALHRNTNLSVSPTLLENDALRAALADAIARALAT